MAVLLLTVVGQSLGAASIGGTFGGAIGGAIGGLLGQAFFGETQHAEGPRLEDLSIKGASEGTDIPIIYGNSRVPGQIIVADSLVEHSTTTEVGGKGAPSATQTTYTYSLTYAVAFGEPYDSVGHLRRMWGNKELTEDYTPTSEAVVKDQGISWYNGSQTTADPDLEALIGIGNVPAYKGICYGVYSDRYLTDYGNRPPLEEAEISTNGTSSTSYTTINLDYNVNSLGGQSYSESQSKIYFSLTNGTGPQAYIAEVDPYLKETTDIRYLGNSNDTHVLAVGKDGSVGTGEWLATNARNGDQFVLYDLTDNWSVLTTIATDIYGLYAESEDWILMSGLRFLNKSTFAVETATESPDGYSLHKAAVRISATSFLMPTTDGDHWVVWTMPIAGTWGWAVTSNPSTSYATILGSGVVDSNNIAWWPAIKSTGDPLLVGTDLDGNVAYEYDLLALGKTGIWGVSAGQPWVSYDNSTRSVYFHYYGEVGVFNTDSHELTIYSDGTGGNWSYYHPETGTVWTGHYYVSGYAVTYAVRIKSTSTTNFNVSDIISDICSRVGLSASDIDVTSISSTIGGYVHTRQGSANQDLDIILKLANAYAVSSDWTLKFLPLGSSSVMTVDENHYGARPYGDEPIVPLEITDPEYTALPHTVQFTYLSSDNNLQTSTVQVENPISPSDSVVSISYPLTATDVEGATLAQQWLQLGTEATSYKFKLPRIYGKLDAGDAITIPTPQGDKRVRLLKVDRGVNGVIAFEAISDNDQNLTAVVTTSGYSDLTQTIPLSSPAQFIYLDTPLLRDADSEHPGPYLTGFTYGSGFPGVSMYQSADAQNYTAIGTLVTEPVVGVCTTVPTSVDFEDWDDTNTLRITLRTSGTLSSTTDVDLTGNNANAVAWGRPGRWEIIQFGTATLVSTGVYDLSHILRGRRGTNSFMDSHESGDWMVVLDTSTLLRHVLSNSDIGSTKYYKAPLIGKLLSDTYQNEKTIGDVPLTPYSPIGLSAADNATTPEDKDLSWSWRVRSGGVYGGPNTLTDGTGNTLTDLDSGTLRVLDDAAGTTILATHAVTGETYTYTEATQISDYGTVPSSVYWQVAQSNATAGLGYWSKIYEAVAAGYYGDVKRLYPVAYWRLGEASGATATDNVGSYDATYINSPTLGATGLITGDTDEATNLDGSSQYVRLGTADFRSTDTKGSIEFMWQLDTALVGNHAFIGSCDEAGTSSYFYILLTTSGFIQVRFFDGLNISRFNLDNSDFTADLNKHHFVLTGDPADGYHAIIDGEEYGKTFLEGTTDSGDWLDTVTGRDSFTIGAYQRTTVTNYVDGTMDEVAVYDYALSILSALRHAVSAFGKGYYGDVKRLYPVAYWRLGEASGTTAVDEMGSYNGTYVGGPTLGETALVKGSSDTSALFDGSTQYITLGTSYDVSTSAFSIELWWKTSATHPTVDQVLYSQQDGTGTGRSLIYCDYSNSYQITSGIGGVVHDSGVTASVDTTYHIILTCDASGNYQWYINGESKNSGSETIESATGNHILAADKTTSSGFTKGHLDEISFYTKELTSTQVIDHYVRGAFADYEALITAQAPVGYWKLNETSGTSAADSSGNGYTGTYTGMAALGVGGLVNKGTSLAADFESATPSYVSMGDILEPTSGSITIHAWVKAESDGSLMEIVNKGSGTASSGTYQFYFAGSGILIFSFYRGTGSDEYYYDPASTNTLVIGEWMHVAMTHTWGSAASTKLWVNGVEESGASWSGQDGTGTPITNGYPFKIGARSQDNLYPFDGLIQQVVFDTDLYSDNDIQRLYRKGVL